MARVPIARRELAALSREKTIVLALAIQLVIAGFSGFLVVGLTSLYDPGGVEGDDITIGISGETQDRLLAVAGDTDGISGEQYDEPADALAAFEEGAVDAVVTGETEDGEVGSVLAVRAVAPAEDLRTTLIVTSLQEYLTEVEQTEREVRADDIEFEPLTVPEEGDGSEFFGFTYTILLPLLLFLPPFISGSVVVDSLTEELERGTLELLRVAPVSLVDIVDGKAGAMVALAPLQALLWIGLLQFNGFGVSNVATLLIFVTAITVVTVAIGVLLALLTGTRRRGQLLYSVLVLALFGLSVGLPEHPASTVALLAVDSATIGTFLHVAGMVVLAVAAYTLLRRYARRLDAETL